jgi:hypothetical protein
MKAAGFCMRGCVHANRVILRRPRGTDASAIEHVPGTDATCAVPSLRGACRCWSGSARRMFIWHNARPRERLRAIRIPFLH